MHRVMRFQAVSSGFIWEPQVISDACFASLMVSSGLKRFQAPDYAEPPTLPSPAVASSVRERGRDAVNPRRMPGMNE